MSNTRHCMSDRIRDQLAQRIYDGRLKAGDRLLELEIAREFDTSQTPVREALRELESLKLVESIPYRGTRVRGISDREMTEAYTVRGVLEQLAGELAAVHLKNNVAALAPIRVSLEGIHASARTGDLDGYSRHNVDFHRQIVVASDNQLLIQAWEALGFEARVRVHLKQHGEPRIVERAAEHDPIVDALEAGDGPTAGRLLRDHAELCKQRWLERPRVPDGEPVEGNQGVETALASYLS
ncbi:GntR family transcriptional regulator [Planctomyces sp. SH-PL14]|jgi:DNA-binding GntR family transcriptional regulator|uniref:GntR family transcriptional regulator n=1 Tax=Planctomyces sp. SH-PL14 TaxID=1632864 RepID=UPI00078C60F9|nr:GntR family transcriptional regulator [Planctomyces sp. SH-PL14]AMV21848.1 HTH-type transcriptional regulator McbR [Planctomyces sp. SH-PL14]